MPGRRLPARNHPVALLARLFICHPATTSPQLFCLRTCKLWTQLHTHAPVQALLYSKPSDMLATAWFGARSQRAWPCTHRVWFLSRMGTPVAAAEIGAWRPPSTRSLLVVLPCYL